MVFAQSIAPLEGGMEQHAVAQLLMVLCGCKGSQIAVVDRGTDADGEECAPAAVQLPARVDVGLAGETGKIDGRAYGRSYRAEQDRQGGAEDHLQIEIRGERLLAVGGYRWIVLEATNLQFIDEAGPGCFFNGKVIGTRSRNRKRPKQKHRRGANDAHEGR